MRLTLRVEPTGSEAFDLPILPAAFLGWEKRTGRKMSQLAQGLGMLDMLELSREQLKLRHDPLGDLDLEAYAERLDDLGPVDLTPGEGPDPAPSLEGASDGS